MYMKEKLRLGALYGLWLCAAMSSISIAGINIALGLVFILVLALLYFKEVDCKMKLNT